MNSDNNQDKQEPIKKINKDNDNKKGCVPVPTTTFKHLPLFADNSLWKFHNS